MKVLVTGGAGYIGSHTVVELAAAGFDPVIFDNFSNSDPSVLQRLEKIIGRAITLVEGDIRDRALVEKTLREKNCRMVIHFAGWKAVGESVEKPLEYFDNNITGTVSLLQAMRDADVKTIVFSSSATVYGEPQKLPLAEDHPLSATNPYGRTKIMIEDMLRDLYAADASWRISILRYFNPAGAHDSGLIGENPKGTPSNLVPFVAKVAAGELPEVKVFGNDYPTPDGTGVRDYIHVADLAAGHIAALKKLEKDGGLLTVNLGTGQGYSVMDVIRAYERASGAVVPFRVVARRAGDIASCYADPSLAAHMLGWKASRGIDDMCRTSWLYAKPA
jgi:UDP-glucose 4-epimerase